MSIILLLSLLCNTITQNQGNSSNKIYKLNFYTQYNQFYLTDSQSDKKTDDSSFWTQQAYNDRLATGDGVLGIGTECYGPVKCEVSVLNKPNNNFNIAKFDHIVEAGIKLKSGNLQILDCPNNSVELNLKIAPGIYRVRIYSSNLKSVTGDKGNDFYKIEIWQDTKMARNVLKRYISKK